MGRKGGRGRLEKTSRFNIRKKAMYGILTGRHEKSPNEESPNKNSPTVNVPIMLGLN